MTTPEMKTFLATYDWARSWQDLPWAHDDPTLFLAEICRRRPPGRALDIGCGAGTDSVFLARQGWQVTALDFMPTAHEYTSQRAAEAGVSLRTVEADITAWQPDAAYDLVLDHGLLHNMDPVRHATYRATVLEALGRDGDFVLLHWHPRFAGQANGRMGPRRVDREAIGDFFAPELQERYFAREEFEDLPDLVGGGMTQAYYWFRRNEAWEDPAALIRQVRATLAAQGVDADMAAAPLDPALLARILGPGRLGVAHRQPAVADVDAVLDNWSRRASLEPAELRRLLAVFGGEDAGKLCVAAAPRCDRCEVHACKRLRYR